MAHFTRLCPARGPVGRAPFDLPRPPDRHGDGHDDRGDAAGRRDIGALDENITCVGVVGEPPPEEGRRLVDGPAEDVKPGVAELRLEVELPCGPFRRRPDEGKHDGADAEHLSPEDLGRVHGDEGSVEVWGRTASAELGRARYRMLWRTNRTVVKVSSRLHNCRSLQSQWGRVMPLPTLPARESNRGRGGELQDRMLAPIRADRLRAPNESKTSAWRSPMRCQYGEEQSWKPVRLIPNRGRSR